LNGGPNGTPSNGVKIENVLFQNVTGSVLEEGRNYYVLCGEGSCGGIRFEETRVVGGGEESFCNEPVRGCPS
jgi:polygalacturonase